MKNVILGDYTLATAPDEINIDRIDFFDELEHKCWSLFKEYAKELGVELKQNPELSYEEDFFISKTIQETVLGIFEKEGIKINYPSEG